MLSHSTHGAGKRFAGDKTQIERQRNTRVQIFIVGTYNPSDTEKNKPKKPLVMNLLNGPGESTLGKLTPLNWDDAEIYLATLFPVQQIRRFDNLSSTWTDCKAMET